MNIMQRCQGGYLCPFCAIPPAALDAPFARFAPAALKSFWHPGGVPIFDRDSRGRGTKILRRLRGGVCIFYRHFSRRGPSPPTRNSEQSLVANSRRCIKLITNRIHSYLRLVAIKAGKYNWGALEPQVNLL